MKKINRNKIRKIISEEIEIAQKEQLLNEGVLDFLSSALGVVAGSVIENLKNTIARFVVEHLGIIPNTFLATVVIEFFENVSAGQLWSLISRSEGRCRIIAQGLIRAIGETLIQGGTERMGLESGSVLFPVLREMITNAMGNSEIVTAFAQRICAIDFRRALRGSGASPEATNQIVSAAQGAPTSAARSAQTTVGTAPTTTSRMEPIPAPTRTTTTSGQGPSEAQRLTEEINYIRAQTKKIKKLNS